MSDTGFLAFVDHVFNRDKPQQANTTQETKESKQVTGWKGIKLMFQTDEFGTISTEANSILQSGCMGAVVGAFYGGFVQGRGAHEEFMRNNEVTKFRTAFEAQSKLQNTITVAFGKGALKWSWRIGMFTTLVIGTSTLIQVYTGTYGIREYAIAGAVAGSTYKFFLGPRAWLVGGAVGGTLGLVGGACSYGLLQLTGQSLDDTKYWQHRFTQRRQEMIHEGLKMSHEEDELAIVKMHDVEVGKSGENLENLEKPKTAHLHIALK